MVVMPAYSDNIFTQNSAKYPFLHCKMNCYVILNPPSIILNDGMYPVYCFIEEIHITQQMHDSYQHK